MFNTECGTFSMDLDVGVVTVLSLDAVVPPYSLLAEATFFVAFLPVGNDLMDLSGTIAGVVLILAVMVVPGSSLEIAMPSPVFIIILIALSSDGVSGKRVPITIDCEVGVFSAIRRGTS